MDMAQIGSVLEFAPIIIVVLAFIMHHKLFVTPACLEKKHRDIMAEVQARFASLNSLNEIKAQFSEVKMKIDRIYDYFLKKGD